MIISVSWFLVKFINIAGVEVDGMTFGNSIFLYTTTDGFPILYVECTALCGGFSVCCLPKECL